MSEKSTVVLPDQGLLEGRYLDGQRKFPGGQNCSKVYLGQKLASKSVPSSSHS